MVEQIDLFAYSTPKFHIGNKRIRLIELFAGIGSQFAALKRIGANVESWKCIEWDKYAIASFNAVHGTNYEPSDIQKIHAQDLEITETDKYCYILTYSFPCQDLSLAGNRKGYAKDSGTRSGLLWEVERLLDECGENLPQVLLMENVPQVISKSNGNLDNFHMWRRKLEQLGYSNYVQLLNAKNYGIPQNRNRCFMISILGQYHYTFPQKQPLRLRLKDMLEDKVDEKYYLSDKALNGIIHTSYQSGKIESRTENNEEMSSLRAKDYLTLKANYQNGGYWILDKPKRLYNIYGDKRGTGFAGNVWDQNEISPTLDTMQGGNRQPMVEVYQCLTPGRQEKRQNGPRFRGENEEMFTLTAQDIHVIAIYDEQNNYFRKDGTVGTLTTDGSSPKHNNRVVENWLSQKGVNVILDPKREKDRLNGLRIRKLTPKECWRLMGFTDEDFDKAKKVNSDTQLYKQAGNSIVVDVLEAIFKEML